MCENMFASFRKMCLDQGGTIETEAVTYVYLLDSVDDLRRTVAQGEKEEVQVRPMEKEKHLEKLVRHVEQHDLAKFKYVNFNKYLILFSYFIIQKPVLFIGQTHTRFKPVIKIFILRPRRSLSGPWPGLTRWRCSASCLTLDCVSEHSSRRRGRKRKSWRPGYALKGT